MFVLRQFQVVLEIFQRQKGAALVPPALAVVEPRFNRDLAFQPRAFRVELGQTGENHCVQYLIQMSK